MSGTVVLTGATGGIGRATAERLVGSGWRVVGLGRDQQKLKELSDQLGEQFRGLPCDLRDRQAIAKSCEQIVADGPPEVLINNAGLLRLTPTHQMDDATLDEQLETVLIGTILMTRSLLPSMLERKRGLIINIGSVAGERAAPKMAAYGAAKAAVIHFTRSLALEYAGEGIRAVCINPGAVETGLMDKMMFAMIQKRTPLKRLAQPAEVAALIEYLVSEEAGYITGSEFTVDGGVSL